MTDILHRAWNVLEPGERPEGMEWHDVLDGWSDRGVWMPDHTAYDRLVVAVEGVDIKLGMFCEFCEYEGGVWQWREFSEEPYDAGTRLVASDQCRLTAAVLALESERGSDA